MNIADELMKLQQLHESGALSDQEFAKAKDAVLSDTSSTVEADNEGKRLVDTLFGANQTTLGDAANRYVSFQITA